MQNHELERLQNISLQSLYSSGVMKNAIEHCFKIIQRYAVDGSVLELGPAEGLMTHFLSQTYNDLTLVEGSACFCEKLSEQYPNACVVNSTKPQLNFNPRKG